MVSKLLDENGPSLQASDVSDDIGLVAGAGTTLRFDVEAGAWQSSNSAVFHEKIRSGRQQFRSLVQQLDFIFSTGMLFIRRNPMAQLWSLIYFACLHIWVVYILFSSDPKVSGNGAVFSLENINKTSGP